MMNKTSQQHFVALSQLHTLTQARNCQGETLYWLQQDLIRFARGETGRDDNALVQQLLHDTKLKQQFEQLLAQLQVSVQPVAAAAAVSIQTERITDTFALHLKQASRQPQTYVVLTLQQPVATDGSIPVLHMHTTPPQRLVFSALSDGKAQVLLDNTDRRLVLILTTALSLVC